MTFNISPSASFKRYALAGLLAAIGVSATAQVAPTVPPASSASHRGEHMGMHDPAKMQAMMARHQAALKAKLNITPAQEGAWTSYTAAMQPAAHAMNSTPEQRAEFDKLTTPDRIDKMRAMRTQRMTEMSTLMDQRDAAIKAFYAALNPDQQKVYDAEHKKHGRHGSHGGPDHHGAAGPKG